MSQAAHVEKNVDSGWGTIYTIGGIAALTMAAITLSQFVVFAVAPPPLEGTAADWFALFQKNALFGLLAFEFSLVVYVVLAIPVALAFYAALRRVDHSLTALFLALSIVGSACFIMARPALEMLLLSGEYTVATSDAQRAALLAAGEGMVATFHGTAFQVSYILGAVTGFVLSAVMLKSAVFSKTAAYLRLASSVLDFGIFIPVVGLFISLFSVVFLLVFNILIGRRLLQLGRREHEVDLTDELPSRDSFVGGHT
jgi:hypothetical protein